MQTILNPLRRSIASIILATALATPLLATAAEARAQFAPRLPSPVAATELESMLRGAGVDAAAIVRAVPLHDAYFRSFREFEEREVDASLKNADNAAFGRPMTVDEAKQSADMRRRIFARAAQIDGQLVEQIAALMPTDAAAQAQVAALRNALARRRAVAAVPTMGFGKGAHAFDLRSAPALGSLDASARSALGPSFEAYDGELTRQLERLAEASFVRRVRAAEAREQLGVTAAPEPSADIGPEAQPGAEENSWMRKMREVQRLAGEESAQIDGRIRRLHRETLARVAPMLPAATASSLRSYLVREIYASIGGAVSGDFDAARREAEALRTKGTLDDARWAEVTSIIEAHEGELRSELESYLSKLDEQAARNEFSFGMPDDAGAAPSDPEASRERCNAIIVRNAATLRAAIGQTPPEPQQAIAGRGIDLGEMAGNGALDVTGGVQIAVMGGDGEAMVLGSDDLADSGIVFGGMLGGGGGGVVKPMSREELDRLAERLGFGDGTRVVFDELVARCVESRAEAERADEAKKKPEPEPAEGGAVTLSISIGEDGAVALGQSGPADPRALAAAIEAAEERMFDDLKAVADPSKADAAEAARRARARTRLLVSERGAQSADIVAIVESAALDATQRGAIAADVREWDESSVAALRTMRDEVVRATEERERLMEKALQAEEVDQGEGGVRVARAMQIDAATMEEMQRLEQRTRDARDRVVTRNRTAVETLAARLESSPAAASAVRRGFYRVLEPSAYRIARDLEPFFAKGVAIEALKPEAIARIEALRAEWIESREALCEKFVEEREKERAESKSQGPAGVIGMGSLAASSQARKRLSADLEQLETTTYRRLRELLVAEAGEEKAASIGELPAKKKRGAPAIQFGG